MATRAKRVGRPSHVNQLLPDLLKMENYCRSGMTQRAAAVQVVRESRQWPGNATAASRVRILKMHHSKHRKGLRLMLEMKWPHSELAKQLQQLLEIGPAWQGLVKALQRFGVEIAVLRAQILSGNKIPRTPGS